MFSTITNSMKEKKILLLSDKYPYSDESPFVKNELLSIKRDIQIVATLAESKDILINTPNSVELLDINRVPSNTIKRIFCYLPYFIYIFFNKRFYLELKYLIYSKKFSLYNLFFLILQTIKGDRIYFEIKKKIKNTNNRYVFYSYWLNAAAYAAVRLREKFKGSTAISRGHGYDLYEDRLRGKYRPYRPYILSNLDLVAPISKNGTRYIKKHYLQFNPNIYLSRLGTDDYGTGFYSDRTCLHIVSCSSVISVKRVHLIAESLQDINISVKWNHFGNGDEFKLLKEKMAGMRNKKVKYILHGFMKNYDIIKYYQENPVDLFINVSESEGIPVSIMEAISFGTPIIATNVGGTGEIVFDNINGILLDKNFSRENLQESIKFFYGMNDTLYNKFRINSRKIWEDNFQATINIKKFYEKILE